MAKVNKFKHNIDIHDIDKVIDYVQLNKMDDADYTKVYVDDDFPPIIRELIRKGDVITYRLWFFTDKVGWNIYFNKELSDKDKKAIANIEFKFKTLYNNQ